jgi:hypothetical protein
MSVYSPVISVQSSAAVDVTVTGISYQELVNSLSQYNFLLRQIFLQALSFGQVMQPLSWMSYDSNGIKRYSPTIPAVDPYQYQPTILLDITPENVLLDGRSQLSFNLLASETVRFTVFAEKNYLSDYLAFKNKTLVYPRRCICPGERKYSFNLVAKNNTGSEIQLSMLNIGGASGFFNSRTQYGWNITPEDFTVDDFIAIQVRSAGSSSFTTYTAQVLTQSAQGIVDALNSLGVGIFYTATSGGSVYIYTNNDEFVYGDLTTQTASTFTLLLNKTLIVNPTLVTLTIPGTMDVTINWGDGTSNTYTNTTTFVASHVYGAAGVYAINFYLSNPAGLTRIGAGSEELTGVLNLANVSNLTTISLPNNDITSIDISGNPAIDQFDLSNNELSVAQVNASLVALAAGAVNNGTYDSSGQTPAAPPSGVGAAAVLTLQGRGWTVTTD